MSNIFESEHFLRYMSYVTKIFFTGYFSIKIYTGVRTDNTGS
jgi:hypothetical protein